MTEHALPNSGGVVNSAHFPKLFDRAMQKSPARRTAGHRNATEVGSSWIVRPSAVNGAATELTGPLGNPDVTVGNATQAGSSRAYRV
jgi:hypothetical protein